MVDFNIKLQNVIDKKIVDQKHRHDQSGRGLRNSMGPEVEM